MAIPAVRLFDLDGKIVAIHSSIGQSLTNNNHAGIDGFRDDWTGFSPVTPGANSR